MNLVAIFDRQLPIGPSGLLQSAKSDRFRGREEDEIKPASSISYGGVFPAAVEGCIFTGGQWGRFAGRRKSKREYDG